ncbi:MAG: T9SS type A sorting domain-containing protein [Bacteroidales bacterium]|nr:T9SS type A sorting domain-containing protein [Bacteroidales bacterium]
MKPLIKCALFFLLIHFIYPDHAHTQDMPRWRWARTGTDATVDLSISDTLGNTVIFGQFTTTEFSIGNTGTTGIVGAPSENLYLAKYTSTGALMWLKSIAGTVPNTVLNPVKVITNSRGDITILGTAINTPGLRIDNTVVSFTNENEQMFIAKFHKTGRLMWARIVQVIGTMNAFIKGNDICMNDMGEVLVTGHFIADTAYFNLKRVTGHTTDPLFFLAKYTTFGLIDWVSVCGYNANGDNGAISGLKVAVSNANEVTVAGEFYGYREFYLGADTLYPMGGIDVFVTHFAPDGNINWTRKIQGTMNEMVEQLVVDNNQNILIAGVYNSDVAQVVDQEVVNSSNGFDLFVAQIKPEGFCSWARNIDTKLQTMDMQGIKAVLHVDEISDVYIATIFQGEEVLVNTLVRKNVDPGTTDLLFARLEGLTGIPVWSKSASAVGENWFNSVVYDRFSNVYFTADINTGIAEIDASIIKDTLGFGGDYIAKINRLGEIGFTRPVLNKDSINLLDINTLSVDYFGNLYVSGVFQGDNNTLDDLSLATATGGIFTAKYAYSTNITGRVTDADGNAVTQGYVKLYGFTRFQRSPISDSVRIDAGGYYFLNRIPFGRYIIYARPLKENYPASTPTYYPGAGQWEDATQILINSTEPITGIDIIINMPDPLPGSGGLGGNIFETDSIISNFKSASSILKQPAKEVSVVLVGRKKDSGGDVVAVVYTDENGDFIISGIADGYYTLMVDVPGLPHAAYYDITISGGQFYGNLDYELGLEEIYPAQTSGTDYHVNPSSVIHWYPNPCHNELRIRIDEKSNMYGVLKVEIFNMTGQLAQSLLIENPGSVNTISTEYLDPGIYFIRIGLPGTICFGKMIRL